MFSSSSKYFFVDFDVLVGVGSDFFEEAIYNNPKTLHVFDAEFVTFFIKFLPTLSLFCWFIFSIQFSK
jgi:hypothetical protein